MPVILHTRQPNISTTKNMNSVVQNFNFSWSAVQKNTQPSVSICRLRTPRLVRNSLGQIVSYGKFVQEHSDDRHRTNKAKVQYTSYATVVISLY